ncbi:S-adenosyl-L-methionine-dependent methyltransferase [Syncephalastrum racemosum]|uniref:mRNA cap guanine-N(7) methyltransferase n=1 Tax=Syncephalastrum racemosum TaxID=13706 RepID=A0A1X2HSB7_SYNRA|nr:S-adenosyl-L-methionine-dependent methyltransferase [Syncephalastrum racemosum]
MDKQDPHHVLSDDRIAHFYADYAGIHDKDTLICHLETIRSRLGGENQARYKCIDRFNFAYSRLATRFYYPRVLAIGKQAKAKNESALLLDIGCCTGTDLRHLLWNGYPGADLIGTDISCHYIECGYDLFQDKSSFPGTFVTGDLFDPAMLSQTHTEGGLNPYRHRVRIVYTGSVIHLLRSVERTREFIQRVTMLLQPGGLFVGTHVAANRTTTVYRPVPGHAKQYLGMDVFREALVEAGFVDIEMQMEDRTPDPYDPKEDDDFRAFWLSFCAIYRPQTTATLE